MDPRLTSAPVVTAFAQALKRAFPVVGLYAGGSLASGDYHPGISDLDLVALVESDLSPDDRTRLAELHGGLSEEGDAGGLHCAYLPLDDLADWDTEHLVWAFGELFRRPLGGIGRAELLSGGITVFGPPANELLPPMDDAAVKEASRSELAGYWAVAVTKPELWLEDVYVDLGLITLARVEETLASGRLITKREAIERLPSLGVDAGLVEQIARRRRGEVVSLTEDERRQRADHTLALLTPGIAAILSA